MGHGHDVLGINAGQHWTLDSICPKKEVLDIFYLIKASRTNRCGDDRMNDRQTKYRQMPGEVSILLKPRRRKIVKAFSHK